MERNTSTLKRSNFTHFVTFTRFCLICLNLLSVMILVPFYWLLASVFVKGRMHRWRCCVLQMHFLLPIFTTKFQKFRFRRKW